jgi:hypothetical protein
LAVRQARQSSREISLGDRRVITRPGMLVDPRDASRGRQFAWPPARSRAIGNAFAIGANSSGPQQEQQPTRRIPFLDRRVTSDSGNREACGDDPRGSFAIFSDVGLFLFRGGAFSRPPARPVWRTQQNVRLTGSSRGRLIFVSSFAFTVTMLGRRPRRHCCTRFVVRCARPARDEYVHGGPRAEPLLPSERWLFAR